MGEDADRRPDGAPAHDRSGDTVDEAIEQATKDSDAGGVLKPPEDAHSGEAPVEQVRGDEDMTGR